MIRLYMVLVVSAALVADASAYRCVFCLPGKYKSVIANNACLACPRSTYVDYSGADHQNDCLVCPANSQTLDTSSSKITDCQCNPGFFGPPGGPCTPCAAGRYASTVGQSACSFCPAYTNSPAPLLPTVNDELTDCTCVAGYTGADGLECAACAVNTYKTTTGSAACTACVENTMTLAIGSTNINHCICTPGYTAGGSSVNLLAPYSSTVCTRFIAMTYKPSFASVATRNNVGVGSAIMPTYNPTGGPNGKGHVSFDTTKFQYLDSGPRTLNMNTNGGLTIVVVVKFIRSGESGDGYDERVLDFGSFGPDVWPTSDLYKSNMRIHRQIDGVVFRINNTPLSSADSVNFLQLNAMQTINIGSWTTIVVTCNAGTLECQISINGVLKQQKRSVDLFTNADKPFTDHTYANTYLGRNRDPTKLSHFFHGDIAGVFVVDEYMSAGATTDIADAMKQGMDLTTVCDGSAGGCTGCSAGKYKVSPGPAACTDCGANTYSEAMAASAAGTCVSCPGDAGTAVSVAGNGALNGCKCNLGYTGPDGSACSACVAGSYKPATGSMVCATCDTGKFSTAVARTDVATCQTCPLNSNTVGAGHDAPGDCTCNAGYTGADGVWCDACVPGKFKSITGSSECLSCGEGKYSTVLASVGGHCTNCPANTNAPAASGSPVACTCNAGSTGGGGTTACTLCVAGTFKVATGPAACSICPADWYSTEVGATSDTCLQCPENSIAPSGSDELTDCVCKPGYTGANGGPCVACVAGKFKTVKGSAACLDCPMHTFSVALAKTDSACTTCLSISGNLPSITLQEGSSVQTQCLCDYGYSGADGGACSACGAGKYKDSQGSATCSDCVVDTYQPFTAKTASTDCSTCPTSSVSPAGSSALGSCECKPGFFGPNGGVCATCYAGRYKTEKGPQDCTLCGSGKFSTAVGASSAGTCENCHEFTVAEAGSSVRSDCHCKSGYFTEDIGLDTAKCVQCKQGSYNSELNAVSCSMCSSGKYTADFGATSGERCITCESGYSEEGFAQCEPCPLNSTTFPGFRDKLSDCKCEPGYTGKDGQTCVHCMPGTFKEDHGSTGCSDCPIDTYSTLFAAEFQTDCQDCAANSEAPRKSDSRDDCKCHVGYTSTVAGTDGEVCGACAAGKFKDALGHATCSDCPEDTYGDTTGSSSIHACMPCFSNSMSPAGSVAIENCLCMGGYERAAS